MVFSKVWSGILVSIAVLATCLLARPVVAQNIATAQLSGTVHDPTGAVIPGATITISDASKGFSRTTTSDGQGNYQLLLLPPGTHTITATAAGFAKMTATNVVLTVGEQAQLPHNLAQLVLRKNVQVVGGLVEHQRARIVYQRPRQ